MHVSAQSGQAEEALTGSETTPWIVSPKFDLIWIFGGAALSLIVLGLHFGLGH